MASEIREKPLPTPHPDQPRTPPAEGERERERKGGREPGKAPEFDLDEMVFDSCVDDLDLQLSGPAFDPDPALHSNDPAGGEKKLDPATAELFEGVRHGSGELSRPRTGWGWRLLSRLKGVGVRVRVRARPGLGLRETRFRRRTGPVKFAVLTPALTTTRAGAMAEACG